MNYKRFKFGQFDMIAEYDNKNVSVRVVLFPRKDIAQEILIMRFGSYPIELFYTQFESDLREQFTEYYEILDNKPRNYNPTKDIGGYEVKIIDLQIYTSYILDFILCNFKQSDFLDGTYTVYIPHKECEYYLTDDIVITYRNMSLPLNCTPEKIYLNITSRSFGTIFDNPVPLKGVTETVLLKLQNHQNEIEEYLNLAKSAVQKFEDKF